MNTSEYKYEYRKLSVVYEPCGYCDGRGYHKQEYDQEYTTVPGGYTLTYTCAGCNGSGRGKIKEIIE
jgi:hypothetical protein